jgi:hypothetical protein
MLNTRGVTERTNLTKPGAKNLHSAAKNSQNEKYDP